MSPWKVEAIDCEGIIKNENDKPTVIHFAITFDAGFRGSISADGQYREKKRPIEYAEMDGMTEPLLIGCPDWDKLMVTSFRESIDLANRIF